MTEPNWPKNVRVGHTGTKSGKRVVLLNGEELTPVEAREVAKELILRADFQDRTLDTFLEAEIPRRRTVEGEGVGR